VVPVLNADSVTSTPCHHALLLQENPHLPRKGGAAGRAGTDTGNTGKLSWLHLTSSRPFHYDAVMSRASHIHLIYSTVEYGTVKMHTRNMQFLLLFHGNNLYFICALPVFF